MIRVQFTRSGGFAGIPVTASCESDSLTPEDEDELRRLIESAGFFQLPATVTSSTSSAPGADRFAYRLTVEVDGEEHTVDMEEAAVPPESRPLLEWLSGFARRRRGGARI